MELIVKIGADQQGLADTLARIKNNFTQSRVLGGGLVDQFAGVVSTASIVAASKATIDWAGKLRDVADALGVNVEWLQKMQNGAKLAGGSIDDLGTFIAAMNKSREEAFNDPNSASARAFGRMGISSGDVSGLSTQDFFDKIVKSFGDGASVQALNDLQEVGGKSARKLAAAFATQFESDAPILSEAIIDQLDEIGDRFTSLATQMKVGLAPGIVMVAEKTAAFVNWIQKVGAFFGGFLGGFEPMKAVQDIVAQGGQGNESLKGAGDIISETLDKAMIAGGEAILRTEAEQNKLASEIAIGTDAKKRMRRQIELGAPMFERADNPGKETKEAKATPFGFQGDAMAQVGLFTGSSLAYNDKGSAVQTQIDLLTAIKDNTSKITGGDFQ